MPTFDSFFYILVRLVGAAGLVTVAVAVHRKIQKIPGAHKLALIGVGCYVFSVVVKLIIALIFLHQGGAGTGGPQVVIVGPRAALVDVLIP